MANESSSEDDFFDEDDDGGIHDIFVSVATPSNDIHLTPMDESPPTTVQSPLPAMSATPHSTDMHVQSESDAPLLDSPSNQTSLMIETSTLQAKSLDFLAMPDDDPRPYEFSSGRICNKFIHCTHFI